MGYGSYSHQAHVAMTRSRSGKGTEVFTQRSCNAAQLIEYLRSSQVIQCFQL